MFIAIMKVIIGLIHSSQKISDSQVFENRSIMMRCIRRHISKDPPTLPLRAALGQIRRNYPPGSLNPPFPLAIILTNHRPPTSLHTRPVSFFEDQTPAFHMQYLLRIQTIGMYKHAHYEGPSYLPTSPEPV